MAGMVQVPYGNYGQTVNRIQPALGPEGFKTYGMSMPLKTHWRKATCAETDCEAYMSGWVTTVDISTELGRKQYDFCKADKERRFSEQRVSPVTVKLVYAPGFPCFRRGEHRLPLDRPVRYYVTGGDWRGNPRNTPARTHSCAEDWVEDFSLHQDTLKTAIERG